MSEAQSCGLHLSFGSARNASPLPRSTSCFSIFRFISIFPRPFHARFCKLLFLDALWLTWNLSLNSAVAPLRMDVGWILREFWSTFEPSWNSIHVSRRSRQKSHDCRRSPSCRRAPLYIHTRAIPIEIREIRSINNQESDKKFNVEPIKLFYVKYYI